MGSNEKLEFYRTYAPLAVEQMIKYGIPASVTLAQAWTERGAAQSQDNNFFGIKCGSQWIADGKPYVTLNDDAVGEKFRRYGSAGESFEDHSRLLLTVSNYSQGRSCAPDDYLGWCKAVSNGYSTTSGYGDSLRERIDGQAETRLYDLRQYDRMAMERARQMGVECGYLRSAIGVAPVRHPFSLPLEAGEGGVLVVTDPYHK
ncbi:MAG: glucosaminidase domain-containing protein, partial [Bacteroidales bacterium]|nr:glucosaminidase domain-containing protein [Bacteroidales bacterium]